MTGKGGSHLATWTSGPATDLKSKRDEAFASASSTAESHSTYIHVADQSEAFGEGELSGVPFAVKDNIDVGGMPTTAGSSLLEGFVPEVDSSVVGLLREAGGLVVGKTNMHELAFGVTSNNATYGACRNPVDPDLSTGGSSGGSAATVALGTVPFSLGTDTGGSVTLPASFCGVVGYRPSAGRYPSDGVVRLSWTRDTIGIHATTVGDARAVDQVITRSKSALAKELAELTLGVPRSRFEDIDGAVDAVARGVLERLRDAGVTLVDVELADDLAIGNGAGMTLVLFECARTVTESAILARGNSIGGFADVVPFLSSPDVAGIASVIRDNPIPPDVYEQARAERAQLRRTYAETFSKGKLDALILPTCAVLPPPLGEDNVVLLNGTEQPLFPTLTRNVGPSTVAGVPILSIPGGRTESGIPVGMNLEGRFFGDDALFSVGEAIERLLTE
jgi:mandelamide amidase